MDRVNSLEKADLAAKFKKDLQICKQSLPFDRELQLSLNLPEKEHFANRTSLMSYTLSSNNVIDRNSHGSIFVLVHERANGEPHCKSKTASSSQVNSRRRRILRADHARSLDFGKTGTMTSFASDNAASLYERFFERRHSKSSPHEMGPRGFAVSLPCDSADQRLTICK